MTVSSATDLGSDTGNNTAGERLRVFGICRPGYGDPDILGKSTELRLRFNRRPTSEEMDEIYSVVGGWLSTKETSDVSHG